MARIALAGAPVLAVVVFMLGFGWSAVRAGGTAAAGTLVLAVVAFDFGGSADPYGRVGGIGGVIAESAFMLSRLSRSSARHSAFTTCSAASVRPTGCSQRSRSSHPIRA